MRARTEFEASARRRTSWVGVVLVLAAAGWVQPAKATIQYSISLAHPEQHQFHVEMRIPSSRGEKGVIVQLPAWNALYQIRDFAYRVSGLHAVDKNGHPLPVAKTDKQTWHISGEGEIAVQYAIYWDDPGPFNSQLNSSHAFLNLAEVLLYVPDRRGESVEVGLADVPKGWAVATSLEEKTLEATPGSAPATLYGAGNYDAMADGPLEVSEFQRIVIIEKNPRIVAVVHGDNWSREQIEEPLRRICGYEISLMGGAPFPEYTFLFHFGSAAPGGGGGMEHAFSTAISVSSGGSALGVSAHEFFHLWNVKRIRPQSLEPVDYTREMWTRSLWFAEGVTSTYGAYTMVRAGLWNKEMWYADLGGQITELETRPASRWKSVEEASLDAWFEKYPPYNRPEYSISYYTKGQILGDLLDILIRDATDNRKSLDDVLRALNEEFAKKGRFYRDSADIRAVAEEVSGVSLGEFFDKYVSGTDRLPYEDVLARAGLTIKSVERERATLGFAPRSTEAGAAVVAELDAEGAAAQAGLREGDVVVELNGSGVPRRLERWLRDRKPGETVHLKIRRAGNDMEISYALAGRMERADQIEEASHATEKQRRIREGLLKGKTDGERR
jgi:predicted metalloprotease with PDZ domain